MSNDEHELLKGIKSNLDASVEDLDAETRHRLRQAREHALLQPRRSVWFSRPRIMGIAMACSALLAVGLWLKTMPGSLPGMEIEAIEIIATEDSLDMYEELEFYRWLAEQDSTS